MEKSTKKKIGAGVGIVSVILAIIASFLLGREVNFTDAANQIGGYVEDAKTEQVIEQGK